jgi:ribosomal protein S27AE
MAEKKDSETGEKDVKNPKAICRKCGSELVIAYGRDYEGGQGFDLSCPKCGFIIFTPSK